MKTSEKGLELIKKFEGLRLKAYICPAGKLTIGYGHVLPDESDKNLEITEEQANELLKKDVETFEEVLDKDRGNYIFGLAQNEFDALVSFMFNVGVKAYLGSTLRERVRTGDKPDAEKQFNRWVHGGGKVLPGLVRRRKAEAKLFMENATIF